MTTVTSLTADRMLAIEAASVVDGDVDVNGNLILTKHDGSKINAGSVMGPQGPQGPVGSMLSVLSARTIQDVGLSNQIRAGRQLSPADFGAMGLSAPLGLWNLSDLTDVSGNGRNLLNKGAVPFATGINGGANTAAQFSGNTGQVLYIPDTGAADPFRMRTGSWGCWFRTAKLATFQYLISKAATGQACWYFLISNANNIMWQFTADGSTVAVGAIGVSNVCDDRWHFAVVVGDYSSWSIYVDGILESKSAWGPPLFSGAGVLNIGAYNGDSSNNAASPHFGRIDEAFVTSDVLSEDQIRNLYCAKIPHTLAVTPSRVSLNVHRRRKGAALAVADFPTQPVRLYNFSGGSLGDEGSNGQTLADTSGVGGSTVVAGVDGSNRNAYSFVAGSTAGLIATDAGLPSGLNPRSYGCWFKTSAGLNGALISWGSGAGTSTQAIWVSLTGTMAARSINDDTVGGYFICDNQWHFAVVIEDNAAVDGIKRKLYVDGRLFGESTIMNAITLAGINRFRVNAWPDGSGPCTGQIDGVFVCDYALTSAQITTLYNKSLLALGPSPKNVGDHIEAMDAASLLATFDTLDTNAQVDVGVAA